MFSSQSRSICIIDTELFVLLNSLLKLVLSPIPHYLLVYTRVLAGLTNADDAVGYFVALISRIGDRRRAIKIEFEAKFIRLHQQHLAVNS